MKNKINLYLHPITLLKELRKFYDRRLMTDSGTKTKSKHIQEISNEGSNSKAISPLFHDKLIAMLKKKSYTKQPGT